MHTVKPGPNNEEIFKATHIAKGYSQIPFVDCHETVAMKKQFKILVFRIDSNTLRDKAN